MKPLKLLRTQLDSTLEAIERVNRMIAMREEISGESEFVLEQYRELKADLVEQLRQQLAELEEHMALAA